VAIDWDRLGVSVVIESTGKFRSREDAAVQLLGSVSSKVVPQAACPRGCRPLRALTSSPDRTVRPPAGRDVWGAIGDQGP
jgi:hypothetical protein